MERGTAEVEVEVLNIAGVDDRRSAPGTHYRFLQLGAYGAESAARQMQADLQSFLQAPVSVTPVEASGRTLYRVRVGPVANGDELALVQQQLRDSGYPEGQPLP